MWVVQVEEQNILGMRICSSLVAYITVCYGTEIAAGDVPEGILRRSLRSGNSCVFCAKQVKWLNIGQL